jgi:hypothetical protein
MKDYDVELHALAKLLHQRHINPRMRVSRQVCGPMSANAAGCGGDKFRDIKGLSAKRLLSLTNWNRRDLGS